MGEFDSGREELTEYTMEHVQSWNYIYTANRNGLSRFYTCICTCLVTHAYQGGNWKEIIYEPVKRDQRRIKLILYILSKMYKNKLYIIKPL